MPRSSEKHVTQRAGARLSLALWILNMAMVIATLPILILALPAPQPQGQFGFRGFSSIFEIGFGTIGAHRRGSAAA